MNVFKKAKALRRAHPKKYKSWKQYVKAAGQTVRRAVKKVSGTKKRKSVTPKAVVKRIKKIHASEGRAIKSLGSVSKHLSTARHLITNDIAKLEVAKFKAKKKVHKRKIAKRIALKKIQFRKLC